jgi:hypothetical protein
MNDPAKKLHEFDVIHVEEETELRVSRMKVHEGWLYVFSYPLGMTVKFVKQVSDE